MGRPVNVGVAARIGKYSDAVEITAGARQLHISGTPGIDKDGNVLPPKPPPEPTGMKCYKCKDGELVIRQGKRGPFLACNKFPNCRTIVSVKQIDNLKKLQKEV